MKNHSRFAALLLAVVMMFSLLSIGAAAAETPTTMYAFMSVSGTEGYWASFPSNNPGQLTRLSKNTYDTFGAERVGNKIYGFLRNGSEGFGHSDFFVMDMETWKYDVLDVNTPNCNVRAMSYDYTTQTMYAIGINSEGYRSLYVVDLVRGYLFEVGEIITPGTAALGLTIDKDGCAWIITSGRADLGTTVCLWSLDLTTAEATKIGDTNMHGDGINCLAYDYATDTVYFSQIIDWNEEYSKCLYTIDRSTARVTTVGVVGAAGNTEAVHALFAMNDLPVDEPSIPEFDVTFVDGYDGTTLDGKTVDGGTKLTAADFPEAPAHAGYEFGGWDYDGTGIHRDTVITATYYDPNMTEATVIFEVEDIWKDGTGYQLLMDADANAMETFVPAYPVPFTYEGKDGDPKLYDDFEYKIPENADPVLKTQNIIVEGTETILVPAGTYDLCVVNPIPNDSLYILGHRGNVGGRVDNYELLPGFTYTVSVYFDGYDEAVDINFTRTGGGDTEMNVWEFESQEDFDLWTTEDADGNSEGWYWENVNSDTAINIFGDVNEYGDGYAVSLSYDYNCSGAMYGPEENWLISPEFVCGGYVSYNYKGIEWGDYDDDLALYVIEGDTRTLIETVDAIGIDDFLYTESRADLSAYAGKTIRLGFCHLAEYECAGVILDHITVAVGKATYDVTFEAGENGTLEGTTALKITAGSKLYQKNVPTPVPDAGYRFIGWAPADPVGYQVNAPVTFIANFEKIPIYTVTFAAGEHGELLGKTSFEVEEGTVLGMNDIPLPVAEDCYTFDAWSPVDPMGFTVTANADFTASFRFDAHDYVLDEEASTPATCTEDGESVYVCSRCGDTCSETAPALGHDYVPTVTEPTCTEGGYTTYTCSRCEDSYTADETEALGHDYVDGICSRCGEEDPNYVKVDPCEGYTDIERSKWYHTAADFVIERGLMGSTSTEVLTFEPNTKVSRAMVASILYRMAESPAVEFKGTFTDVKDGKWFTDAIEWCAQNGLASGKGDGTFDPNGNVTRQELAVFMMKMAEYLGKDTTGRNDLSSFADSAKVPSWAKTYVQWAVDAGLISGQASDGKTYLAPTANATRAEFASIIMRFVQNIAEAE